MHGTAELFSKLVYLLHVQTVGPMLFALIALLGVVVVYKLLDHIARLWRVDNYSDRYVFVTGCDSGFGHALVKRLDSLGCHVFAGCFMEKGETELKKICSERVHAVPIDITDHDSVRNAYELVRDKLQSAGKGGQKTAYAIAARFSLNTN